MKNRLENRIKNNPNATQCAVEQEELYAVVAEAKDFKFIKESIGKYQIPNIINGLISYFAETRCYEYEIEVTKQV